MRCWKCGTEIEKDDRFICPACGADNAFTTEMIRNAAEGSSEAFEMLYTRSVMSVRTTVRGIIKNEDDIEDIIQETYVKAYRNLGTVTSAGAFRTWVCTIARNSALDYARKNKPVIFTDIAAENEDGEPFEYEIPETDADRIPEEHLEQREMHRLLFDELLSVLPDEQRAVVTLVLLEDRTEQEASEILGISRNTVKSRIRYARKKLSERANELKKKGVSLYGLSAVGFAKYLYSRLMITPEAEGASATAAAVIAKVGAAGTVAGGAVKTGLSATVKLLIGGIAASIVVGGTILGSVLLNRSTRNNSDEMADNSLETRSQVETQNLFAETEGETMSEEETQTEAPSEENGSEETSGDAADESGTEPEEEDTASEPAESDSEPPEEPSSGEQAETQTEEITQAPETQTEEESQNTETPPETESPEAQTEGESQEAEAPSASAEEAAASSGQEEPESGNGSSSESGESDAGESDLQGDSESTDATEDTTENTTEEQTEDDTWKVTENMFEGSNVQQEFPPDQSPNGTYHFDISALSGNVRVLHERMEDENGNYALYYPDGSCTVYADNVEPGQWLTFVNEFQDDSTTISVRLDIGIKSYDSYLWELSEAMPYMNVFDGTTYISASNYSTLKAQADSYYDFVMSHYDEPEVRDFYDTSTGRYPDLKEALTRYETTRMGLSPTVYTITLSAGGGSVPYPGAFASTTDFIDIQEHSTSEQIVWTVISYDENSDDTVATGLQYPGHVLKAVTDANGKAYGAVEKSGEGDEYEFRCQLSELPKGAALTAIWE